MTWSRSGGADPGVLTHDIADDRRRAHVHRLLEEYGVPVQGSVFLLELSPAGWTEVRQKLLPLVNRRQDDVRVWLLCAACAPRSQTWCGTERSTPPAAAIV